MDVKIGYHLEIGTPTILTNSINETNTFSRGKSGRKINICVLMSNKSGGFQRLAFRN